ncbi:Tyrosine-protein phosphatase non-receptor type 1 [Hypsibius exemplaris]|uniref:protein-tyrosine-phosphatase n=1 Tax=Hypsibius exemplaris TaxID=2072580 RepID=A0A1W0XB66_HYPEX|nr:Tyrosine-protein phosphatase non-receptor type 1 [Hypsibius exemplaris]
MQCFPSLWRDKDSSSTPTLRKLKKMSIDEQYEDIETNSRWQKIFAELKTKGEKQTAEFTTEEAKKAESKLRNRFRDVLPYDQTRVLLQPCSKNSSDYINASFVQVPDARRSYICSQGPLTSTVGHLWEMIWTHNSPAIVMLNSLIEKGMPTCAAYWPQDLGASLTFDDSDQCHELTVTLTTQVENPVFIVRTLKLSRRRKDHEDPQAEERTIAQFHFTHWPDFGVPQCPDEFLDFLFAVRQSGCFDVKPNQQECDPVTVHCTAGIGRTGTFVLVDVCLALLALYRMVDIPQKLLELREKRMGFVQTYEQLRFCYQAIIKGKKRISIQTPAASPSMNHRPVSLPINHPEPDSAIATLLPDTGSPRRELLRQDGRTSSMDVQDALLNGKRQKVDVETCKIQLLPMSESAAASQTAHGLLGGDGSMSAFSVVPSVVHVPDGVVDGIPAQTDQQARDAALRQQRKDRSEQLRQKVEAIKRKQEEVERVANRSCKPWMVIAGTSLVIGVIAISLAYRFREDTLT